MKQLIIIGLLQIALLITACGQNEKKQAKEKVKIGLLIDPETPWDALVYQGVNQVLSQPNSALSCKYPKSFELVVGNTHATPEGAVSAAIELLNKEKISILLGPNTSDAALPVSEVAEKYNLTMLSITSTHNELTKNKNNIFQFVSSNDRQAELIAKLVNKKYGSKNVALVTRRDSSYGQNMVSAIQSSFLKEGIDKPLAVDYLYFEKDKDFLLESLITNKINVVILPLASEGVLEVGKYIEQQMEDVQLIGTDFWEVEKLSSIEYLEGSLVLDHWHHDVSKTKLKWMPTTKALAIDATNLLVNLFCDLEEISQSNMSNGLSSVKNFEGITGTISAFDENQAVRDMVIVKFEGGSVKVVDTIGW
ncbi:ABC transporter substrate-binding protein [Aliikangiella sp. G2MR2-5]|uniref:ABC transporter substrate-binding protein n=1 Tax=Aliikangiella sp. G2MR2-5 TaxID=2788943 RepID=UPI0018AA7F33|nr:ABC transporter substrate-binding protein [Aliikangiella sp. G2MR2-5]